MTDTRDRRPEPWQLALPLNAQGFAPELIDELRQQVERGSLSSIEHGLMMIEGDRVNTGLPPAEPLRLPRERIEHAGNFHCPPARKRE